MDVYDIIFFAVMTVYVSLDLFFTRRTVLLLKDIYPKAGMNDLLDGEANPLMRNLFRWFGLDWGMLAGFLFAWIVIGIATLAATDFIRGFLLGLYVPVFMGHMHNIYLLNRMKKQTEEDKKCRESGEKPIPPKRKRKREEN